MIDYKTNICIHFLADIAQSFLIYIEIFQGDPVIQELKSVKQKWSSKIQMHNLGHLSVIDFIFLLKYNTERHYLIYLFIISAWKSMETS